MKMTQRVRTGMIRGIAAAVMCGVLPGCAAGRAFRPAPAQIAAVGTVITLTLPLPSSENERIYLGLPAGADSFRLDQIPADIIVVEIFDMYCGYCQKAAPEVKKLFDLIAQRGYAERIKLIGIGKTNTSLEIAVFRDEYELSFPLFADPQQAMARQLAHDAVPYFYVLRRAPDGSLRVMHRQRGSFITPEQFLDAIIAAAEGESAPAFSGGG